MNEEDRMKLEEVVADIVRILYNDKVPLEMLTEAPLNRITDIKKYKWHIKPRDKRTGRFIGRSLVERMIPMEDAFNLEMLKIQQELLKNGTRRE